MGIQDASGLKALLFDLDGTLVDSVPDIAAATNQLLDSEGHAPLEVDEVRRMIGHGIPKLVERALAARGRVLDAEALAPLVARMNAFYGDNLTGRTTLLPGAVEALEEGVRAGLGLAVVTNKPEGFSRTIVAHFGLEDLVPVVVGGDTCATRKPAPEMLLHAAAKLGATPATAVMVGDSGADVDSARAAGMKVIVVRGGYGGVAAEDLGADMVIDTLADLFGALERLAQTANARA
ncbi:phosphoglycolate phosphatase [Stappia indica]|uniref:Phosphoglycolate phosphatase n=1 Tax=Stappia indica TaxID=538381 RepID=A0A285RNY3_9HYPH|nr:phosphoglycolate phosphatase [Stappia indica]SOB95825.1 phosphoglycolate phosphatase [Stappia indica]